MRVMICLFLSPGEKDELEVRGQWASRHPLPRIAWMAVPDFRYNQSVSLPELLLRLLKIVVFHLWSFFFFLSAVKEQLAKT